MVVGKLKGMFKPIVNEDFHLNARVKSYEAKTIFTASRLPVAIGFVTVA